MLFRILYLPTIFFLIYILILSESQILQKMNHPNQQPLFTILHFNDVYDIQPNKQGKFGVVNFQAHLRKCKKIYPNHMVLFSGDCFSPSILTNIFEGKQMVTALKTLGIDVACYGNHQFDLQEDTTLKLAEQCNFPWLLGNIKYKGTDFILGNGQPYIIKQKFGLKIGIFGVAGQDWLGILNEQYQNRIVYQDVTKHSRKMCKFLKQQQHCDMIIALTHMRVYQDQKLPLQVPQIDIMLGGHDHIIFKEFINQIPVIKSGDNFKCLGVINVYAKDKNPNAQYKGRTFDFDIKIQPVPIYQTVIDEQLKAFVDASMQQYKKSDHIVGYTDIFLQTRFSQIRSKQTNYGNFLADLGRSYYDADACILNSGSIRNDQLIPPGQLRYSLVSNMINSVLVVKQLTGKVLLQTLEYSVSGLPGYSGCFLQVSGIRFSYNIKLSPRIQQVYVGNQLINPHKTYTVVIQSYIAFGGDGFQMLKPCKVTVDSIAGIDLLRLILKFFKGLITLDDDSIIIDTAKNEIIKTYKNNSESEQGPKIIKIDLNQQLSGLPEMIKLSKRNSIRTNRLIKYLKKFCLNQTGKKYVCISPSTDNRIMPLNQ